MTAINLGYPIRVSNSEIQTFKDCRRKWWLAYYRELGLKRGEVVGARSLGSRIHLALERVWTTGEHPADLLKQIYDGDAESLNEAGRFTDVDDLWKEYDLGNAMITGFVEWLEEEGIDDGIEVVGNEEVIEVDSHLGPEVKLRGKLDQRIVRKIDGARLFRDFKTVGDLTTPRKVLPMDEQMKFYQLLEMLHGRQQNNGADPAWRTDGGLYLMLRKVKRTAAAKPPFYEQLEVHHNDAEIRSMYKRVAKVVEEIVATRSALDHGEDPLYEVPPRPSRDCTWKCDFFAVCTMFDDGSNIDAALGEYYEHLDPHERYTKEEVKGDA